VPEFKHANANETDACQMHPVAQAAELRDRWERAQVPHGIKPGDLVKQKRGTAQIGGDPVLIFWRRLIPHHFIDSAIINAFVAMTFTNRVDCIVAKLSDSGSTLVFLPAEIALLEPYVPAEES
jgi:hypothetical protein